MVKHTAKAKKEKMTMGDIRKGLVADHKLLIEKAMNKHNPLHDKTYYLLVMGKNEDGNVKTFALVMDRTPPVDIIGTMLYEVNPTSGEYKVLYCKPLDRPTSHIIQETKRSSVLDLIAQNNVDTYTPIIH